MNKAVRFLILALFCAIFSLPGQAKEIGDPENAPFAFRVDGPRKINVRMYQDKNSALVRQLTDGDIVYVSEITTDYYDHDWYVISGGDGWIYKPDADASTQLVPVDNPYFSPNADEASYTPQDVEDSHKWGRIIFIVLAIAFAFFGIWKAIDYLKTEYQYDDDFDWIRGRASDEGMRKRFFFNWEPYQLILAITLALILSLLAAIVTMLVIGGGVFVLLWIVKIITYVLLWVAIIGGVLSAFVVWGGDDDSKGGGCIGLVIGITCIVFKDNITNFADACSDTGLAFLKEFNILAFALDLIKQYWLQALIYVCIPLMLFLACAGIWMIFAGILIGFEALVTWRYNINHPCPHCHQSSEPAQYLSQGVELPEGISLRPGMYGLLHITHPVTEEEMPTMLLNGRDRLTRICPHCGHPISAKEGTEKHIVMAGGPESGKTTLSYRFIAELIRLGYEPEFTDEQFAILNSATVISSIRKIAETGEITVDTLPQKTTEGQTGAMQVMLKRRNAPVDYRLFINDLAGERFSDIANGKITADSHNFFRDANVLIILIDPYTMAFPNCKNDFVNDWIDKNSRISEELKMDPMRLRTALDNAITGGAIDRQRLHINIVLTKTDAGYIPAHVIQDDPEALRTFICAGLGLAPLVQWAEGMKSVNYFSIAAMAKGEKSRITPFTRALITQLGIN